MLILTPASVPPAIDPPSIGWESAQTALAVAPALAEQVGDCSVQVLAAARQVVGVACDGEDSPAYYSDVAVGQAWGSADLLSPEGRQSILDALAGAGSLPDGETDPLREVRFGGGGEAYVVTAAGETFELASPEVSPLLSDQGRLVRGAIRSGGAFTGGQAEAPAGVPVVVAAAAQLPPPLSKRTSGGGDVDCTVEKCIAITYDDGPGPYTEKLLDILAARDAKATFFLLGQLVGGRPETVQRMLEEGHEVANHSWSHPDLRTIGADAVSSQLSRTQDAIEAATGVTPTLMRPPYGATNDTAISVIRNQGLAVIMWDVDTRDWENRSASETTSQALSGAHEGAIILFHDIHPSTVDAAPGIIDSLQSQGYTLVTVTNLLGDPEPGVRYFSASNPGS